MPKQGSVRSDYLQFNYSKKARSFFGKHEDIRDIFEDNIENYYLHGQTDGSDKKKKSGSSKWIRMRIDTYRVIYSIVKNRLIIVEIMLAGNRGEIYKQFNNL